MKNWKNMCGYWSNDLPRAIFSALLIQLLAGVGLANPMATNLFQRIEKITSGPVELVITADPPLVHLDRDILLSIKTIAPSGITVRLPPLENRLTGFTLSGAFDREPTDRDGASTHEHCYRLTPLMAAEYRLAPIAVTYTDTNRPNAPENWFATRALVFGIAPITKVNPGASIRDIRGPVWIYPSLKTVLAWVAILVLLATVGWALYRLSHRIHRAIQLRRMSPRERALEELAGLMNRNLLSKNQVKEFFMELTLIVRRYIERAHQIRAPEQTTQEFLIAASCNPQFRPEVLGKLRAFLQNADLVKFAEYHPESVAVDRAIGTVKDYIATDDQPPTTPDTQQVPNKRAGQQKQKMITG